MAADRKMYQLHIAQLCGLKIPATCITNDSNVAKEFIEGQDCHHIYKIFRGVGHNYAGTTILEKEHLDRLHLLKHCPVIFQEFIELGFDVRITIVGNMVFAAKLTTEKPDARIDIRRDLECEIEPYELPSTIKHSLLKMMSKMGLRYSTIDMRMNDTGECFFLELNPVGQYLYVETATFQPITDALAKLLSDPVPQTY
jgi:glutathione synthase/RimK-type ligase-like ATP-grasp enzyme